MLGDPRVAVVLVCYDNGDELPGTLRALLPQLRPDDELVVVDNASLDDTAYVAERCTDRATVVRSERNLGFAGGCHLGVKGTTAPLLFFLNPDARAQPGCIDALRACALTQPAWAAWQALVTLDDGRGVNSAGNVVHFLGFGWAGGLGRSVEEIGDEAREVGFPSGAALMVRRSAWDATGGFDQRYFMYGEDLDLGLRLRLMGWGVGLVPTARVAHDYEFEKGDYKWFYLERNRWWTVLGVYPGRLLALLLPVLLAAEPLLLVVAWRGGWLEPKLRAQRAVLAQLPEVLRRRRAVQESSVLDAGSFAKGLTARLDSPYLGTAAQVPGFEALQGLLFRAIRALLA